jgi:hypothetical protein
MTARVSLPAPVLGARRLRLTAESLDGAALLLRVVGASDDAALLTTPPTPPTPMALPAWDAAALLALHVQHAALKALAAASAALSPVARGEAELAAAALLLRMATAMREAAWLVEVLGAIAEGDDLDAWEPPADASALRLQIALGDLRDARAVWRDVARRAAIDGAGVADGAAHVAALLEALPDHRRHAMEERRASRAAAAN